MRRLLATFLVAIFSIAGVSLTNAAGSVDEQFSLYGEGKANPAGKLGVLFEENVDTLRMPSLLYSYSWDMKSPPNVISYCDSVADANCKTADFMKYYALMPPCKSDAEFDCIESIYAVEPGSSNPVKGTYKESIPEKVSHAYKADSVSGLPQGSVSGVWEISNVKHGGGSTDYVAIVSRVGSLKNYGTYWRAQPSGNDPWGHSQGDFRAAIYPVNIVRDSRYKENVSVISGSSMGISHPSQLPFDVCAIVGDGVCAMREPFPDGVRFGMVIRFSKVINGWMHGRIDSPEIDYQRTSYGTKVDMKGLSTRVPILAGWAVPSDFSAADLQRFPSLKNANGGTQYPGASGNTGMEQLAIWSKVLKDTAAANPTQWIFYNLSESDVAESNSCIRDSKTLAGFVTTNSTTYTATPPIFNEQTGTLDYKVASPHFLPDGSVFQGKYNLYIDSKVARCIYKFSNAPISASVSITSADGAQQSVTTTAISENNGWLHLSAAGFTFSSPTLKVKLTQDAIAVAPTPTPSVSSQPAPVSQKKSTITCVKGKVTKQVTGVSPKCPVGYKRRLS